ncbi:MAG: hypothetical protein IH986_06170 [Planctomycetes bacterium]|nr:hypothetical protein [Planctomycetota bacterium]
MLLVLTNGRDATADYLISTLAHSHVPLLRIDTDTILNTATFSYRSGEPIFRCGGQRYAPSDFSNVWYRRPERLKSLKFDDSPEGRYALDECTEAFEGILAHIPPSKWMNHPAANAHASHKIEQLTTARTLGFRVPDTIVTQDGAALRRFLEEHHGRIIVKPMAGGLIERGTNETDSLIYTNPLRPKDLADLADLASCPTLFQEYVDKQCDIRITVVDARVHAVELRADDMDGRQRCDIRRNNMQDVAYRELVPPGDVTEPIQRLMNHYNLRFAAIDMAVATSGDWYFLEVNPNGQWAWLDLSCAVNIAASFVEAFGSESSPSHDNEREEPAHEQDRPPAGTDLSVSL